MQGIDADRLLEVIQGGEAFSQARIIFEQGGQPFYFQAPRDEFRSLMPILAKATNPAGPEVTSIIASEVDASLDEAGELLLTVTNTSGAEMTFGLTQALAVKLSALVDEALQLQGGSTSAH